MLVSRRNSNIPAMAKKTAPKKVVGKKVAAPAKKPVRTAPAPIKKQQLVKSAAKKPAPPPAKPSKAVSGRSSPVSLASEKKNGDKARPSPPAVTVEPPPTPKATTPFSSALTVTAQASANAAANGNNHPANILVLVTAGGWPVTELTQDHFTVMEHFEVPGQVAPFSNNMISFREAGSGAYLIQTRPINSAPWRSGHHLGQILVSTSDDRQGQCAFKIIVR